MKKPLLFLLFALTGMSWVGNSTGDKADFGGFGTIAHTNEAPAKVDRLVEKFENSGIDEDAIRNGILGYIELKERSTIEKDLLLIVDFTKSSNFERLYIIQPEEGEVLHSSVVAHGRKSGNEYAHEFSNKVGSNQSSLGFYKTSNTYYGKHGLSLRLDGLEKGINHHARKRAIVIHSAKYANPAFARKYGRLGRSFGCPALPEQGYEQIIDQIKEGALLFIYYPQKTYFKKSPVLNGDT